MQERAQRKSNSISKSEDFYLEIGWIVFFVARFADRNRYGNRQQGIACQIIPRKPTLLLSYRLRQAQTVSQRIFGGQQ